MPRPRFLNLDADKRVQIFEAAAKEFAHYGYDKASLNHILEEAGLSKGAAYYYFDDKADLFISTIQHYGDEMTGIMSGSMDEITPESFWPRLKEMYAEQLLATMEAPWRYGVLRAGMTLSEEARTHQQLADFFAMISQQIEQLIEKGQSLGAIRTDLPQSLLMALLIGFDNAGDDWFAKYGPDYPMDAREKLAQEVADSLERLLKPVA